MSRLMEYFNEVDKNAVVRAAHQLEPQASMVRFGLTAEERNAIMSGDFGQLASATGISSDKFPQLQVIHVPLSIASLNQ